MSDAREPRTLPLPDRATLPPGLLAVPCMEWMWTESARAIALLQGALPPGSMVSYLEDSHSIERKRNELANMVIERPALQWVLFVDSDAVPPQWAALRLLSHPVDIVAALAASRHRPHYHVHTPPIGPGPGDLQEIERSGFHTILVRRRVFETTPFPWFVCPETPGGGSDDYFCDHARRHGHRVYLDPYLEVGHMTTLNITNEYQRVYWQTANGRQGIEEVRRRRAEDQAAGRIGATQ